jgi:hypothetical protein
LLFKLNTMNNVDVEIYLNNLVGFFEKNPNDLIDLIGEMNKDLFYKKVREKVYQNAEKGEEIQLTQKQLIDIVVGMYDDATKKGKKIEVQVPVVKTNYGSIWLN